LLLAITTGYDELMQTPASDRLLRFIGDCKLRRDAQRQVVGDHERLTDAAINKTYAPEVRDLCLTFRNTSASQLNAKPEAVAAQIQRAMQRPRLVQALALQPYANLRDMQLKCKILATRLDLLLMSRLIDKIEAARAVQTNVSSALREQLLQQTVDPRRIASLALVEYAKQMTSVPIDHVSTGATWADVGRMHAAMQQVHGRFVAMASDKVGVELAAMRWVTEQIGRTLRQNPGHARPAHENG